MPHWVLGQPFRNPVQRAIRFILIVLLLHLGCATYQPPATVSEAHRKACEEFAKAEAAWVEGRSILDLDWPLQLGLLGVGLPFSITARLVQNAKARQEAYDNALRQCLGPGDAAVVHSLHKLADLYDDQGKYAEAEPLYRQALAIQEKAIQLREQILSGHSSEAAIVEAAALLEDYAALLRKSNRDAEAEEMEARAKAIRDTIASGTTTNP